MAGSLMNSFFENSAFVLVFLMSFGITLLVIPLAIWLSLRLDLTSTPGGRRRESRPMPKLGGLAVFVGFSVSVIAAQWLPVPRFDPNELVRLTGLLLGGGLIFVVGLLDDKYELNWFWQFVGQVGAAGVAIAFQIFIEYFNNPLTGSQTDPWPHLVTIALTMLWLVLMMNTVNFLDGLDGLAAGVALIAGLMLFINGAFRLVPPQISVSLLPLALVGTCTAFLLFNFHPARIYLGGGALYLGFLLGTLSIIGGAKMATILLVMGLPVMDLAWQAFSRLLQGRNPFAGDRGHLHFRLLDSGRLTHRQIVLIYYVFCSFFGGLTLFLESQLYKLVAFSVMLGLIVVVFALVTRFRAGHSEPSSSQLTSS